MSLQSKLAGSLIGLGVAFSSTMANADCFVRDADQKGFLGLGKEYSRQFSGSSSQTIWERYCKPFIQDTVQSKGILNGTFGMHCTGRLSCNIEGRIVGGRVQPPTKTLGLEH